ncbi:MAG: DUF2238 domain-containing protein [Gammaproteobacteria bacterium]|jgi:putative membrane protein|nr:DUF2238 domain-containing protein [Gammaproteobacteria bacterium]
MNWLVTPGDRRVPMLLLAAYIPLWIWSAIEPFGRDIWIAEIVPMLIIIAGLALIRRWHEFSPLAWMLMGFLIVIHTIGAHYTFELTPFGWITRLFDFERNHYDRMGHFTVGFYAYAVAEMLLFREQIRRGWVLWLFPVCAVLAIAALYEVAEWWFAIAADKLAGIAVLGSQGDIWDAQKDMLSDGLGAVTATVLFAIVHRR